MTRREKLKLGVSVSFNSSPCVLSFDGSYLNGFGPLQIGGVENAINDLKINFTGFKGCIRNIYDDGKMYDLFNPLKEINTELGCRLNNPCPNCNGRGYCEPFWAYAICVCDLGFGGANCDKSKFTSRQIMLLRKDRLQGH